MNELTLSRSVYAVKSRWALAAKRRLKSTPRYHSGFIQSASESELVTTSPPEVLYTTSSMNCTSVPDSEIGSTTPPVCRLPRKMSSPDSTRESLTGFTPARLPSLADHPHGETPTR